MYAVLTYNELKSRIRYKNATYYHWNCFAIQCAVLCAVSCSHVVYEFMLREITAVWFFLPFASTLHVRRNEKSHFINFLRSPFCCCAEILNRFSYLVEFSLNRFLLYTLIAFPFPTSLSYMHYALIPVANCTQLVLLENCTIADLNSTTNDGYEETNAVYKLVLMILLSPAVSREIIW